MFLFLVSWNNEPWLLSELYGTVLYHCSSVLFYINPSQMLKHPHRAAAQSEHWLLHLRERELKPHIIYVAKHTEWAALSWMNFMMSFLAKSSLLSCSSLHSRSGSAAILDRRTDQLSPSWRTYQTARSLCFAPNVCYTSHNPHNLSDYMFFFFFGGGGWRSLKINWCDFDVK